MLITDDSSTAMQKGAHHGQKLGTQSAILIVADLNSESHAAYVVLVEACGSLGSSPCILQADHRVAAILLKQLHRGHCTILAELVLQSVLRERPRDVHQQHSGVAQQR